MDQRVEEETTEATEPIEAQPARSARRRREVPPVKRGEIGLSTLASLTLAAAIFTFLFLMLSERAVPVPEFLRAHAEERINLRFGEGQVRLGSMAITVGRDGVPGITLRNVGLGRPADGVVAVLNRLDARLAPGRLLQGELAASQLLLSGAQITLRRTASGDFAFAGDQRGTGVERTVPGLLNLVDEVFETTALRSLRAAEAQGIVISLEDARSGRIWQATNAQAILRRADRRTTLSLASDVFNGTDDVARVQLSVARNLTTGGVTVGATVADMPAADIALQSPALSWLGVLDAGLSGSVRTEIGADGGMTAFAGTLDIDAGALRPLPDVPPVAFSSARTYFTFDPARQRIDFSELAVVSEQGRLAATGRTYLAELNGPWPAAFLGQFTISALEYDGEGVFPEPLRLADVRADLRLRLDPFTVEIGQLAFDQEEAEVRARGRVTAETDGWHVAFDAESPAIRSDRVMRHWPVIVSPVTRGWLSDNLRTGILKDVAAGLRVQTGRKPDTILSFEFDDGEVRFLKAMPPLTDAAGRATLFDRKFTLFLDEGRLDAGAAGVVDASGSVFTVPDTRPKPAMGEIEIVANGPLQAALTVLNRPPLRIMDRAGRTTDLAEADARTEARIVLPLKNGIKASEVDYEVSAVLTDVASDAIAEGRVLTSDRLTLSASPEEVRLDGPLRLDGVPVRASWRQPLGAAAANGGWVEGTITLSNGTVEALDIPLPDGLIAGRGTGRFRLDLPRDGAPELRLTSDLTGLSLELGALGWRKSAGAAGGFELRAELGETPQVEALTLSAPGLDLEGGLSLGDGGGFESASFDRVRVGDWLEGRVDLTARGAGRAPAIRLRDGRLDLRRMPEGGGGSGDGAPIEVELRELIVSDGLRLAPLAGTLEQGRAGLSGRFQARVNGGTAVRGTLAPANAGTAVRIQSDNAGGVIGDAGLTPNIDGGTMDLVLTPVVGAPAGTYDGQFLIENVRVRKAPAMADLLDAISVVGLIDQLAGPGILFNEVDGTFRLTRNRLTLRQAAGVGGSLGISADGIYDLRAKVMDFQGVISPVYFLNGIGAAITRRGEGLFGFNYRVTGSVEAPKVGVNPLSILTPGFFRQLFRRPPPGE